MKQYLRTVGGYFMDETQEFKRGYDELLYLYNESQEKPKEKLPTDMLGEFLLEYLGWSVYNDEFYYYDFRDGTWEPLGNLNTTDIFSLVYKVSNKYNTDGILRAVLRQLRNGLGDKLKSRELTEQSKATVTVFNNGVYDYKEHVFKEKSKEVFALNGYNFDYSEQTEVPEIYAKWLLGFLNSDTALYNYWLDELANLVQSHTPRGRIQLIKGNSGVGKSLFTDLITKVALKTASINSNFVNSPFALEGVGDGGTLLISPDLSDDLYFNDNERLKTIATGDTIEIQRKGKKNTTQKADWITVFACNTYPKFKNRDEQMIRRFATTVIEHKSLDEVLNADWYADINDLLADDNVNALICYLVTREYKRFVTNDSDLPNSIFLGNKDLWNDSDPLIMKIVDELEELEAIHVKTINDIAKNTVKGRNLRRGYKTLAEEITAELHERGYNLFKRKLTEPYSVIVDGETYERNGGKYESYVKKVWYER